MGIFKNIFGKKTCALCGNECGVMSRTKIKNGDYICGFDTVACGRCFRNNVLFRADL